MEDKRFESIYANNSKKILEIYKNSESNKLKKLSNKNKTEKNEKNK